MCVAMLLDPAKASVGAFRRKAPERHCAAALVGEELFFVGQSEKTGVGWGTSGWGRAYEVGAKTRHPGRDWCFSWPVRSAGLMWLLWRGRSQRLRGNELWPGEGQI